MRSRSTVDGRRVPQSWTMNTGGRARSVEHVVVPAVGSVSSQAALGEYEMGGSQIVSTTLRVIGVL